MIEVTLMRRTRGKLWIEDQLIFQFDEPHLFTREQMQFIIDIWHNFPWLCPIDAQGKFGWKNEHPKLH